MSRHFDNEQQDEAIEEAIKEVEAERTRLRRKLSDARKSFPTQPSLHARYEGGIAACEDVRRRLRKLSPILMCGHHNGCGHEGSPCQAGETALEDKLLNSGYARLNPGDMVAAGDVVVYYATDDVKARVGPPPDFVVNTAAGHVGYGVYRRR